MVAVTVVVVSSAVTWPRPAGAEWGLVVLGLTAALPYGFVCYGVRRSWWPDRHISVRELRLVPLGFTLACLAATLVVLEAGGAPRQSVPLMADILVGLAVFTAVTLVWKVSLHTAVTAGCVTILCHVIGPPCAMLAPLVVLVGWARVRLRQHTLAQVVGGVLLGTAVVVSTSHGSW